jgi:predicted nucleotidyltransferase
LGYGIIGIYSDRGEDMIVSFDKIRRVINSIADKYDVKRVSVFGSYAKGTQNENSDVDLLVEFNTRAVSLFKIINMKDEIEEKLEVDVDLVHGPLKEDSIIVIEKKVNIYEN